MNARTQALGNRRKLGIRNPVKIFSIAFVAVFIMILALGVLNAGPSEAYAAPDSGQIEAARSLVSADLQAGGEDIDDYEVQVTNRMVGFIGKRGGNGMHPMEPGPDGISCPGRSGCSRSNVEVILKGNSSSHLYVVDTSSRKIVMHSRTKWFD